MESRIDHILGHKTSLNKFKKPEIISSIFTNYSGVKLEINYKKKTGKFTNTWRLNNTLLKNQWVNEEIKKEIKIKTFWQMKMEMQHTKTYEVQQKQF